MKCVDEKFLHKKIKLIEKVQLRNIKKNKINLYLILQSICI